MQHQIEYDADAKILIGTTLGPATVEGFLEYLDDVAGHPNLPHCVGLISDHRDLSSTPFTIHDVRIIVERARAHAEKWRDLLHPIVVSKAADFGMARMYEIEGDSSLGYRVHVCYTLEEARAVITGNEG
jgi:hypothetical protein